MIEEHSVSGQSDVVLETIYVVYGMYMEVMWQDKDVNVMDHYGQGSLIVEVRNEVIYNALLRSIYLTTIILYIISGWWCDEWCCDICCCTYRYPGLADADETSIAAGIALQSYYEGRVLTREDLNKCVQYWRDNISEMSDPVGRKRDVCW